MSINPLKPKEFEARLTSKPEVVCEGSPKEMGLAQGEALRAKVFASRDCLSEMEAFTILKPKWLPYKAYRKISEFKANRLLDAGLRRDGINVLERLQGISEGSGLSIKSLSLINALEPFLSNVSDQIEIPMPGACSAIAIGSKVSSINEPFVGKNFDYIPLVQPFYTIRESRPKGAYRSLEFTLAPLAGTIDGINEAGLCITNNYAYTTDEAPPTSTLTMLTSQALQKCATVKEAADYISSQPRWGGGILMLADSEGDMASLELSSTRSYLRRTHPEENKIFHTNSFSSPQMQEVEVDRNAVFTSKAPKYIRGKRMGESSELRIARLTELLKDVPSLSPEELSAIMSDHGPDNQPGEYTVCCHSDYQSTTASLQLFPKSRRIRVDFTSSCNSNYQEIAL